MAHITTQELRERFAYDESTGVLRWAKPRSRIQVGAIAGRISSKDGYWRIETGGRGYAAHRLIWQYVHGEQPDGEIDHINGNRADNRISNLRVVTRAQNCQNRHNVRSDSKTGVLGACKNGGTYKAEIVKNGVRIYLGRFKTAEAAGAAYNAARA